MENTIKIVEEFFKRRFPDKKIEFEKECGYFYTWVTRFRSQDPKCYMDEDSLAVFKQMKAEGMIILPKKKQFCKHCKDVLTLVEFKELDGYCKECYEGSGEY